MSTEFKTQLFRGVNDFGAVAPGAIAAEMSRTHNLVR